MVRQSYNLKSAPPDISCTQLAPCMVITIYIDYILINLKCLLNIYYMQARKLAIIYSNTICFCSPHNQTSQSIFFNATNLLPLTLIPTSFPRNLHDFSHTKTLFDPFNTKMANFIFIQFLKNLP